MNAPSNKGGFSDGVFMSEALVFSHSVIWPTALKYWKQVAGIGHDAVLAVLPLSKDHLCQFRLQLEPELS